MELLLVAVTSVCLVGTVGALFQSEWKTAAYHSTQQTIVPEECTLSRQPVFNPTNTIDARDQSLFDVINTTEDFSAFLNLVQSSPTLTAILKSPNTNATLFVPTNLAFSPIKGGSSAKEEVSNYHVIAYPLSYTDLVCTPTLPTLFQPHTLNGPQRMRVEWTLCGPVIDNHSRVLPQTIHTRNGYLHVVSSILQPPQKNIWETILELPSSRYSTFQEALRQVNVAKHHSMAVQSSLRGSTAFVPTNVAFEKLGKSRVEHLFSPEGGRELETLVNAHIIANRTLYSNAYYESEFSSGCAGRIVSDDSHNSSSVFRRPKAAVVMGHGSLRYLCQWGERVFQLIDKNGMNHRVEVLRLGRLISMVIDESIFVSAQDKNTGSSDGVVHGINTIL